MKRYRLTGMLDARGIEPDEGGMLVLYQDHAELLAAIRAALDLVYVDARLLLNNGTISDINDFLGALDDLVFFMEAMLVKVDEDSLPFA